MNLGNGARVLSAVVIASALTMSGCSDGDESRTLRLGMVAAEGSVQQQSAERMADKVAEASGGELAVEVFPAGQIGSDESLGQDISRGDLDLAFLNQGSMAGMDPLLDFHYLPYIATNYAQADELFYGDGIIPTTMRETLREHGIRALGWYELEFRGLSNSGAKITEPTDLEGQKIRVPGSAAISAFFDEMGAHPTPVPFPELYTALQQRTVDGQDNGLIFTFDNRFYEINPYYTMTKHVYATGTIAMSEEVHASLSPEEAEWVESAAVDAQKWEIDASRKLTDSYIDKMEAEGTTVTELTDSQMAEFQKASRPVWDDMAEVYGKTRIDALKDEVESVEDLK